MVEVENALKHDRGASFHDCWSKEARELVANVRRQHCTEMPGRDRGIARAKFLRDDMVLNGTEAGGICSVLVINIKGCTP